MMKTARVQFPWAELTVADDPCFTEPAYESETFTFLDQHLKGNYFVDIGAHQGIYTSFLARKAGSQGLVHAIEPNPANLSLLLHNVQGHVDWAPVILYPMAILANTGHAWLHCWHEGREAASGISQTVKGEEPDYKFPVPCRRLDSLPLGQIDFIKVDVEHAEIYVLESGLEIWRSQRPQLLVELHSSINEQYVRSWAEEMDYEVTLLETTIPNIDQKNTHLWLEPMRKYSD